MQWVKCKDEKVPKHGKYLCVNKDNDVAVCWYEEYYLIRGSWFGSCEYGCGGFDHFEDVTHWMPLPDMPKDEVKTQCLVSGCRNLETRCVDCGRLVCSKICINEDGIKRKVK